MCAYTWLPGEAPRWVEMQRLRVEASRGAVGKASNARMNLAVLGAGGDRGCAAPNPLSGEEEPRGAPSPMGCLREENGPISVGGELRGDSTLCGMGV